MTTTKPSLNNAIWERFDALSLWVKKSIDGAYIRAPKGHPLSIKPFGNAPYAWLEDERIVQSLAVLEQEVFGASVRRYGHDIPEISHIIWVAHRNFNNTLARGILQSFGIDPVLAAFVGLHHDTIETMRANAKKGGVEFKAEAAFQHVLALWPEEKDHGIIRAVVFDYMTDQDPNSHGSVRIDAQRKKSLSPTGDVVIYILNAMTRSGDKLHHVLSDMLQRMQFKKAKIDPSLPISERSRYGLPDEDLAKAIQQAKMKKFAVEFGAVIPRDDAGRYHEAIAFLENEFKQLSMPDTASRRGMVQLAAITIAASLKNAIHPSVT